MGWNSSSPYEQGQRRSSGGSGYGSPSPRVGGQSSWSYGGGGGYDEQWSNQQSPWRRQSGELTLCVLYHSLSLPLPVLGTWVIQQDKYPPSMPLLICSMIATCAILCA